MLLQAKAASQGKAATTAAEPAEPDVGPAVQSSVPQMESVQQTGKRTADPDVAPQPHQSKRQKTVTSQTADAAAVADTDVSGASDANGGESILKQVKWKKLAAQVLEASSGTVKLSKLQKRLRTMARVDKGLATKADAAILARLKGSSQFVISGKSVGLAKQQTDAT